MRLIITILSVIFYTNIYSQDTSIVLDGSASIGATVYHWRQISGTQGALRTPNLAQCEVDSLTLGLKIFELTCTNQFGISKDSVFIVITYPYSVEVISATYKTTKLLWTVTPEKNVASYFIQKTKDGGKTFTKVTNYYTRGKLNYTYYLAKTVTTYMYQITPIFRNTLKGQTVIFK